MTTEYKIGDRVLVEATIVEQSLIPGRCSRYKIKYEGLKPELWMPTGTIYSHVPAIKPGTRVNVRDNVGDDWKGVKKDGLELYYLAPSVFEDGHVIYAGYTTTTYRHVRPHVEETKTTKTVSVEVPDGYKVIVVKEEK